jgi:uncharacterized membrane protein YkvA (DUF1232 family)
VSAAPRRDRPRPSPPGYHRQVAKKRTLCPACGQPSGSNAACLACRDAAARELAQVARDVTPGAVPGHTARLHAFLERPPWWARFAPGRLLEKARLLRMLLRDWHSGSYRRIPWVAVAALVAAAIYVVSPLDLIPDFLVPIGWTDDLLVVALAWGLMKRELRDYCAWKGLSPATFGL